LIANPGIRHMLAAAALNLAACAGLWWRVWSAPSSTATRRAGLATAFAGAQAATLITLAVIC
jgi:hypothetical protein